MRATIESEAFRQALRRAGTVVKTNPTLPVLGFVHAKAELGWLRLTGTNLDVTVVTDVPAQVGEEGEALLNPRMLAHLAASADTVTIATRDGGIAVQAGRASANLRAGLLEDWPRLPALPPDHGAVAGLADAVTLAAKFCSDDPMRPALRSVQVEHGHVRATDGFRMILLPTTAADAGSVPVTAIEVAAKCGEHWSIAGDEVRVVISGGTFVDNDFVGERWWVTSKRIPAEAIPFDKMRGMVEPSAPQWFSIPDAAAFVAAVRLTSAPRVKVISMDGDVSVCSMGDEEVVVATDAVPLGDLTVAYDANYLASVVEAAGDGAVVYADDPLKAAVLVGEQARLALMAVRL